MTCSTSMCLSESRKKSSVILYRCFTHLSLFLSFYIYRVCVWLSCVYVSVCVSIQSVYSFFRMCSNKVWCWVLHYFTWKRTILFNIHYHHPHHSPLLSQKFHVLLFLSARHPIDTFAIQQKKYFYYSLTIHLGS